MSKQLVVIDPSVANYQSLIDQLGASYSYLLLSADSDGVTQIANYIAANSGFDAIHLISHGSPGQVAVGTSTLSEATLSDYTAQLNQIGASLNTGGDLLIYGCDVAQGVDGQRLITELARVTRLDVAASTNRTGSSGDWVLEVSVGTIEHALPELSYDLSLVVSAPPVSWTRLIGSTGVDSGYALTPGLDGAIYVAGYTGSANIDDQTNAGGADAFVTKFRADGTKVWTRLVGSDGGDSANDLTTGLDGSIYVVGDTSSAILDGQTNAGGFDAFVTKFEADGTKVWTRLIGSGDLDYGKAITIGGDGAIYVVGDTSSAILDRQTNAGDFDAFVTKFEADGTKVWTRLIGSGDTDYGNAITIGGDGSIYVGGVTYSANLDDQTNAGGADAFVTKFEADGTKVWTRLVGSTDYAWGNALTTGLDGSIYIAGVTAVDSLNGQTIAGGRDAFVTKFGADGSKGWTRLIGSNRTEEAIDLTTGLDGSIYVVGNTSSAILDGQTNAGGFDAFVTKFEADGTKVWTRLIGSTENNLERVRAITTVLDGAIYVAGFTDGTTLYDQTNSGGLDAFLVKLMCFARGTLIQTAFGPVPVEDLQVNDPLSFYVAPTSNDYAKVKWIGRQTLHPVMADLIDYLPIKISANALGPGQPFKDLYVSPDHAILFDGTLIHAKALVNGTSIVQMTEWSGDVEYFHIETEHHELVYANGVPAETFIDNVSRKQFDNYAEFEAMYPNAPMMTELDIPRVLFRRQLSTVTVQRLNALQEVWDARYRPTDVATESV